MLSEYITLTCLSATLDSFLFTPASCFSICLFRELILAPESDSKEDVMSKFFTFNIPLFRQSNTEVLLICGRLHSHIFLKKTNVYKVNIADIELIQTQK